MQSSSLRLGAALATAGGGALLGLSPIVVRVSELGPLATSFWRFAIAAPILALGMLLSRAGRAPEPPIVGLLALAGAFFAADILLWTVALSYTSVANATLLSNMTPVFAALLGWLALKERVSAQIVAGAALGLAGAGLLAFGRDASAAPEAGPAILGDALGLFSALWYAGYLLIVRAQGRKAGVLWVMTIASSASCLICLIAALAFGEALWPRTPAGWGALLVNGVVVQVMAQGLIAYGVARLPIALSTVLLWMQPLTAALISWAMFGESLGVLALSGAVFVLAGMYVVQRARAAPGGDA